MIQKTPPPNLGIGGIMGQYMLCLGLSTVLLTTAACTPTAQKKKEDDEVRLDEKRLETEAKPDLPPKEIQSQDKLTFPNTPAGQSLVVHFDAIYAVGEDAEANYQRSLAVVRENAGECAKILTEAYSGLDAMQYGDRWIVLQTLSDLETEEALDPLIRFAQAELPARDSIPDDVMSPYAEESVLRITAIRGIANLAPTNDRALEAITSFFNHKDEVIRLEALNSFADAVRLVKNPRLSKKLITYFPEGYLFDLRFVVGSPPNVAGANPGQIPTGAGKGPAPIR